MRRNPRLYFDEDMSSVFAARLRRAGWDVLTAHQAARDSQNDLDQLTFATEQGRVRVTGNAKHFVKIHCEHLKAGRLHAGILVSCWRPSPETILKRLIEALERIPPNSWPNSLQYA